MDSRDISQYSCKAEAFEASEDIGRNPTEGPTIGDIIDQALRPPRHAARIARRRRHHRDFRPAGSCHR